METDRSLLEKAKSSPSSEAWFTLTTIYEPLIAGWVVRAGVEPREIGDITQEVFKALLTELPKFEHNGNTGAFRNWLKTTTIFRCRRYWDSKKKQVPLTSAGESDPEAQFLNQLEDPKSELSQRWNEEHDKYVISKILELVANEFDAKTYEIFQRNSLQGESPQAIAEDLGIDVAQVYKSKFKVLTKLKKLAKHLVDVSDDDAASSFPRE